MLLQKKMARKKGVVDFKQEKKKKMNKRKPKKNKKPMQKCTSRNI